MKQWYLVTVTGPDRSGIVAGLTGALYQAGANLGAISMARLGGHLCIMLMAQTEADEAALRRHLEPFAHKLGLRVHIDPGKERSRPPAGPNVKITVHGADRPGVVAQVSAALSDAGMDILGLDSDVGGSADKPVYIMVIDGYAAGGVPAITRTLEPVRLSGIEVRLTAIGPKSI
ncbi:MAG: glycine cleavage system transcriptional repressor [Sulfuricaulis sp.]